MCERCGHPKDEHIRIVKEKIWSPAGMGFMMAYAYLCPDRLYKGKP